MQLSEGQVAVVTGGASGIGLALARAFGDRGLGVVIADVRREPLDAAVGELEAAGIDVLGRQIDVRDQADLDALAEETVERFGRVDVVCNNAGMSGPRAPMWEQELSAWRWTLDVHLMGVVHGVRSFVPRLIAQGSGHVLNTASIGGLIPLPNLTTYNAAKHAIVGISETLRDELALRGTRVGVSVLCPGRVATDLRRSSEETRPGEVSVGEAGPPLNPNAPAEPLRSVLASEDVARAALDGIERDQLHILTHADSVVPVRARINGLMADIDASLLR